MRDGQIERLYDALERSHFTVAVTGAGISLSAGGVSFDEMLSGMGPGVLMSGDPDPDELYRVLYRTFLSAAFDHGPTVAHRALARLEEMGKLQGIITTNEDCIHTIAGSKNVAELEGGYQVNTCERCGYRSFDYEIWKQGHMPACPKCGGIMLPYDLYSHAGLWEEAVGKAQEWMRKAELILIVGTNGYYGSVYWNCRKRNAEIIQINPARTGFDRAADLNIRRDADSVFAELMKLEEAGTEEKK